jgi:aldehyde oxidoreductase
MTDAALKAAATTGAEEIGFILNGKPVALAVDPRERLSDALRYGLGQTGTKVGCNAGDCGACTVLVDGEQVCACLVSCGQVEGRRVTTVEGLAGDPDGQRLQQAFLDHGAAQCGICTPGMLMAAISLLKRVAAPTKQEVQDALGGVLCRCTGYQQDRRGGLRRGEGVVHEAPLAEPATGAAVGARLVKSTVPPRLTGRELYGADRAPEGALWLRVIRSPHARARFTLGDLDAVVARDAGPGADPHRCRRAGQQLLRRLPAHQGPAGAGRRRSCATAARRCWRCRHPPGDLVGSRVRAADRMGRR